MESFGGIQLTPLSININGKSVDLNTADIQYFFLGVDGLWNSKKIAKDIGYEFSIHSASIDYNSTQLNSKLEMKLKYNKTQQIFSIKDTGDLIETDSYTFTISERKTIDEDMDEELKKIIIERFQVDGFDYEK